MQVGWLLLSTPGAFEGEAMFSERRMSVPRPRHSRKKREPLVYFASAQRQRERLAETMSRSCRVNSGRHRAKGHGEHVACEDVRSV